MGISALVRRYPVAAFFTIAYLISWLIWLPRLGALYGWNGPVSPYLHLWGSLGPAASAFIVAGLIGGRPAMGSLLRGMVRWRVGWAWWLVAVLGPLVVFGLGILIVRSMGRPWPDLSLVTSVAEYPALGFGALVIVEFLAYGYGEEVGWRGFVLPCLQRRRSAFMAALLLSIGWTLWHIPLLLSNETYRQLNPVMLIGFFLSLLTGSILMAWLYNSTGGSILLVAIFHTVLDLATVNRAVGVELMNVSGMLYTLWGVAILVLLRPARLARKPKVVWPAEGDQALAA